MFAALPLNQSRVQMSSPVWLSLLDSYICNIHPLTMKNAKYIHTQHVDTFIMIKN